MKVRSYTVAPVVALICLGLWGPPQAQAVFITEYPIPTAIGGRRRWR